eukprot:2608954-Prymnesium_polylepis.3
MDTLRMLNLEVHQAGCEELEAASQDADAAEEAALLSSKLAGMNEFMSTLTDSTCCLIATTSAAYCVSRRNVAQVVAAPRIALTLRGSTLSSAKVMTKVMKAQAVSRIPTACH